MTLGQQKEVYTGPLRILIDHIDSVENNMHVLINCCNNKKLPGRLKAFDDHFNMVLEEVKEQVGVPCGRQHDDRVQGHGDRAVGRVRQG